MVKTATRRKRAGNPKDAIKTIEAYFAKLGDGTAADSVSLEALPHLFRLIAVLRGPGGCPWDVAQHFADYPQLLEEEVAELKEAVTSGNREAITEELGDAAWNLLYLLYLAQDERGVPLDTVLRGVLKKIVRRHEHVFGSVKAETPEEVLANWRKLKQREKRRKSRKA
ncbi:MAG: MazG nucleotide pyrophosphohydrolase domain-containing protein [bacterium]